MKKISYIFCSFLFLFISNTPIFAQNETFDSGKPMSVGLVLSGGGAKGIAHIGVIRALEENNIPIDYIAGTSMGAIIGGLYACGYTTEEMMQLLLSKDFSYWSTGRIDPSKVYYFSREAQLPVLYTFDINTHPKDSLLNAKDAVAASLINPLPMNFAFMDLFAKYTAQTGGDFNKLMVPFRCVASDVKGGHKVVHSSGNLGDAIRTSMSFPLVFQPIKMNGVLLYDGGLYDNFPVDVMTEDFAPDIMIGVDVSASDVGPQTSLMDQIDNLVMRTQSYDIPAERGIKLRINLDRFSLLDFPAARVIEKIGYDHAVDMMDSICHRVTSRISPVARATHRGVFKSQTPKVVFDNVVVTGGNEKQNSYVRYLFEPAHTDTFDMKQAEQSFYRAITPGRLKDLFPQAVYNETTGKFTLDLKATPKDKLSAGVGGYLTSSTNSFLFLSLGWRTLTFTSLNLKLNTWLGQSYMAAVFDGSINLKTPVPSALGLTGVVSRQRFFESDRLFYQIKTPSFIVNHEYFARGEYSWAASRTGRMALSLGYGMINDSFFRTDAQLSYETGRDNSRYRGGEVRLSYNTGTIDQINFPTQGHQYDLVVLGTAGRFKYISADKIAPGEWSKPKWLQFESRSRNYWNLSRRFSFGLETDILYSTRPLHNNYNAAVINAPAFNPTPMSYNSFNTSFHANSFAAATVVPIFKYSKELTARVSFSCFMPFRRIEGVGQNGIVARYGKWFNNPEFYSELDINYALPFGNVTLATSYTTSGGRPWSVGISFGYYLTAPKFLR